MLAAMLAAMPRARTWAEVGCHRSTTAWNLGPRSQAPRFSLLVSSFSRYEVLDLIPPICEAMIEACRTLAASSLQRL